MRFTGFQGTRLVIVRRKAELRIPGQGPVRNMGSSVNCDKNIC